MSNLVAWDGTAREFWLAVGRHENGTYTEGDVAVLCEVLELAQEYVGIEKLHEAMERERT